MFAEGDVGSALFVVESGEVEILLGGHTINTLGPGAVLGEISVLSEQRRTAGARAKGATTVLSLEADRFRAIVALNGEVGLCVIDVLTERLRVAAKREADLRAQLQPE